MLGREPKVGKIDHFVNVISLCQKKPNPGYLITIGDFQIHPDIFCDYRPENGFFYYISLCFLTKKIDTHIAYFQMFTYFSYIDTVISRLRIRFDLVKPVVC